VRKYSPRVGQCSDAFRRSLFWRCSFGCSGGRTPGPGVFCRLIRSWLWATPWLPGPCIAGCCGACDPGSHAVSRPLLLRLDLSAGHAAALRRKWEISLEAGRAAAASNRYRPWQAAKYWLLSMLLGAALYGVTWLLAFDPIAILVRSLGASVLPALDRWSLRAPHFQQAFFLV